MRNVEQCANIHFYTLKVNGDSDCPCFKIAILVQMHCMEISYNHILQHFFLWISQKKVGFGVNRLIYASNVCACWFIQVLSIGVLIYTQFCIMAMSQGKSKPASQ